MRAKRRAVGCVRYDKRRGTWNYLFYDHGKRRSQRIGTKKDYPTKAAAWKAVTPAESKPQPSSAPTVAVLVDQYRAEKMPTRYSTRRSYDAWLRNHVLPKFGAAPSLACDSTCRATPGITGCRWWGSPSPRRSWPLWVSPSDSFRPRTSPPKPRAA